MSILYSAYYSDEGWPFDSLFDKVVVAKEIEDLQTNDGALILWGGEDIWPGFYGQEANATVYKKTPSVRDLVEVDLLERAIEIGLPIIGICRGHQLVAATRPGGKLIQHVENHGGNYHKMELYDGSFLTGNSIHHQMVYPWDLEEPWELLAWTYGLSGLYIGENEEDVQFPEKARKNGSIIEPEAMWFPKIKAFTVQGHPEMCNNVLNRYVQWCLKEVQSRICSEVILSEN
jgi:gamma-glutamyl-gamma-aminobutyrate hydrolase PuuD